MKTTTLAFPTYESIWAFKDRVKTINISITPKKNTMTGRFNEEEIELAVEGYKAVLSGASIPTTPNATQKLVV